MRFYKLRKINKDKESGILEKVKTDSIDYEKDFENWLENSPAVLLDDDSDEEFNIQFNVNQKLFIVAEEISPIVKQVESHLRNKYKVDIYCMEYEVLKTQQGEFFSLYYR